MILPIVAYGDPVLKKTAVDISKDYANLKELISNMYDTMYYAQGVGLAAPQVGLAIRLFIVDAKPFAEDEKELKNFKKVFINAKITEESGEPWSFNEGCLSFPKLREDIQRKPTINITYLDENFESHTETYSGIAARIIQHEYDHIEGILMIDRVDPLKKIVLKRKLSDISKGLVKVTYKMKYPQAKRFKK